MSKKEQDKLDIIYNEVKHIRENMATKSDVSLLKWAITGIASLAMTALFLAGKGGF